MVASSRSIVARGLSFALAVALFACTTPPGPVAPAPPEEPVDPPSDVSGDWPPPRASLTRSPTGAERTVAEATVGFGFRLLREVARDRPDENLFVSPLSVLMAMGMALEGARGETAAEMRATLDLQRLSDADRARGVEGLLEILQSIDPTIESEIANAAWLQEAYPIVDGYADAVRGPYGAHVERVDFGTSAGAERVNGWVAEKTRGRIRTIVQPGPKPGTVAMLTNAVYFRAGWRYPFDERQTREGDFRRAEGGVTRVPFMRLNSHHPYAEGASWRAVELPYAADAWAATLVLPREGVTVERVVDDLLAGDWGLLLGGLESRHLRVEVPRFEVEAPSDLVAPLMALGIRDAFGSGADFSAMAPGAWIGDVAHKTWIRFDEKGTEAAAATNVVMVVSEPPTLSFDRPFLLVLRERLTGTVLFVGTIEDPGA